MKLSKTPHMKRYILLFVALIFNSIFSYTQNVGIGTTNPSEKLTVDGTIRVERNSNSGAPHLLIHETEYDYTRMRFTNSTADSYFNLAARPSADPSQARFNLYNSDFDSNIFTATASGRLGVNTVPAAGLHVNAVPETDPFRVQINNATKFRIFSNDAMVFGTNWSNPIADVYRFHTPHMFIGFDGNHVPEERLEVDGSVVITGGIVAGSTEGTSGQILTTGADGNLEWSSPCAYNRFIGYPMAGTATWTVPSGVTEILVELWGGGGGADYGGGGGSGGYVKAIFKVSSGNVLTVITGAGGTGISNGGNGGATDGDFSSITGPNVSAAALGGKMSSNMEPGEGGAYSVSLPYLSATAQIGGKGKPNVSIPIYSGTSKLIHGDGGQSPYAPQNYGQGEVDISMGSSTDFYRGTDGSSPGGGAGGGIQYGNNGGVGYVIIKWNE